VFRKAVVDALPHAKVSVDGFHLVQLANLMVTRVRQRLVRDRQQRRGRLVDPAWVNRRLLLRGYSTLSAPARARLDLVFATDDPTQEFAAAWGVEEQLRRLLEGPRSSRLATEDDHGLLRDGRGHGRDLATLDHHRHLVAWRLRS
jgi:hypothetical protein